MIAGAAHYAISSSMKLITSEKGLNNFLAQYNVSPVPRTDCLVLDSDTRSADATAQEIIRHFGLIAQQEH
jgi:hypothetical protein